MGHFGRSGTFSYYFIIIKTSLSRTLFSVSKSKMNLTKWDTLLFKTSLADVFITFQRKSGVFEEAGDNKTNEPDNEEESVKQCNSNLRVSRWREIVNWREIFMKQPIGKCK